MPIRDKDFGVYKRPQIFGPTTEQEVREFKRIRKKYQRIEKLKKIRELSEDEL